MNEDQLEQETIDWLKSLDYDYRFGPDIAFDGPTPERRDYRGVILHRRLEAALRKHNPGVPQVAIDDAIGQITNLGSQSPLGSNRSFHQLLTTGINVQYQMDGETRGDRLSLVNWTSPENNDWLAVNQFSIKGDSHTRRPDIILFLNGIPFAVIELKNPADENADIWKAYEQLQTYKEQIPDLFLYNELLVISDGTDARFGSLSASKERYMQWRTIDGKTLDPLGDFRELETLIFGLFDPKILVDFLRYFVLFEHDGQLIKKVAGYHQFHAVLSAVNQVVKASSPGGDHKGGVVWHTQGSGKSITMVCFAAMVMRGARMKNPTIVMITDRNDLDGQLFGVFSLSQDLLREQPVQIVDRKDLRSALANRPSGGIIFTTIQKFMPGEDEDTFPELSGRHNIVVIADEAHRTQYGFAASMKTQSPGVADKVSTYHTRYQVGYAQHLRDALPNATFVAFTGTPVSSEDRDTRSVFGDYISIYDMQQAQEDGATVAIYFESRLAKLGLKTEELSQLDEEVEELTEDEEESQQAKLKSRWTALEKVVGAGPRVEAVAADIVKHFEDRQSAQSGKAMVVAMSRDICVHLYDEIVKLRPDWHDTDPTKGAIKIVMTGSASDKALLRPHIYSKQVKKDLEKRFKNPSDPLQIVIVRDMWLTGFDAPCVHTLYIDKPMKGHNLMQAIARVNRVFRDKQGGLVVDYIGIANELKTALKQYTGSNGRGKPTVDAAEAFSVLEEKVDILRGLLHGFDYSNFLTAGHSLLAGAANHVLGLEDGKRRLADAVAAMSKAFSLCCTLDAAKALREEVAFFQAIKVVLTKRDISQAKQTGEAREFAIRQIIDSAVVSEDVVDVFQVAGLDKPNIGLLDDSFLAEVRNMPERNLAVELLERLLEGEVKARFAKNAVQNKKFSEMLASVIKRYQNRAIETAQVIEELIEMARKFREASNRGETLGLSEDEVRFYDALADNESAVVELGDETLKKIAHELTQNLRENISVDWTSRESVQASLRLMVKRILRKYKYPPDKQQEAIQLVLQQAALMGEQWAA